MNSSGVIQTKYTGTIDAMTKAPRERRRQRRVHPRMEEQVAAPGDERQEDRVEHQESVRAEEPHEWGREQRIHECLAVEESLLIGVGTGTGPYERRAPHQPGIDDVAPAFQEESGRARGEFAPDPDQVLATVREVAVLGEAVSHHVVRGLVTLDPHRRAWEVDGEREAAVDRRAVP